ncbi:hypothetical protein MASR2M15_29980 [Anaerolineales bacterium]
MGESPDSLIDADSPLEHQRSVEYGSLIIHSMETGIPRTIYGNVPNQGSTSNLPLIAVSKSPSGR